MLQQDYEAAIEETKLAYEEQRKKEAVRTVGARAVRILAHPSLLLGVVVAKASVQEVDRYYAQMSEAQEQAAGNRKVFDGTVKMLAQGFFVDHCLCPANNSQGFAHIMREAAIAFTIAFPQDYMILCGVDADLGKRRG